MIVGYRRIVWAAAVASVGFVSCAKESVSDRTFAASDFPQSGAETVAEAHPSIEALQDRLAAYESQMVALGIGDNAPVVATRDGVAPTEARAAESEFASDEDAPGVAESVESPRASRSRRPRVKQSSAASSESSAAGARADDASFASPPPAEPAPTANRQTVAAEAAAEEDAADAAMNPTCTSICALTEAVCGLQRRICQLADEHSGEQNYQDLCTRAGEDCERAAAACDVCGDPEVP